MQVAHQTNHSVFQPLVQVLPNNIATKDLVFVFADRFTNYLNEFTLYTAHYNAIPNYITEIDINCKKLNLWINEHLKLEIKDVHYNKRYTSISTKPELGDIYYCMYEDVLIYLNMSQGYVKLLFRTTNELTIHSMLQSIRKFKKRNTNNTPKISLLVNGSEGIETKLLKATKPKLSIHDNYNDDFKEVHQIIVKKLSKKNEKGLVLLHGKPGTGKTSYIRFLMTSIKKKVIFLPPNMASAITNPSLISILIDNPNSIFVIEDAENIVIDRERNGQSPVSALLNISDGLLADCLNVQIICSFNTDISKVDAALMRKGRLIAKYEFKELTVDKAQNLSNKLGFSTTITKPMTLTSIYNQGEKEFHQTAKTSNIGFRANL